MLKKLTIQGFRGIKEITLDDFKDINLFVGNNNCGKSTILEALFTLCAPRNSELLLKLNGFRGYGIISESAWLTFFHNLNFNNSIKMSAELRNGKEKRELVIKPNIASIMPKIKGNQGEMEVINIEKGYSGSSSRINGLDIDYYVKKGNNKRKKSSSKFLIIDNKPAYEPKHDLNQDLIHGIFINSLTLYFREDLVNRFNEIQRKKNIWIVLDILKKIEPKLKDLRLGEADTIYCDIGGYDSMMPVNFMGGGEYKFLHILLSILSFKGGIVFIDEIENGFHPSIQKIVWDAIIETANKYNVQVFATTHSLECISALNKSQKTEYDRKDCIRIYRIEKKEDDFRVVKYDRETLMESLDSDWDVR